MLLSKQPPSTLVHLTDSHSFAHYSSSLMLSVIEQLHCSTQKLCVSHKCSIISYCWGGVSYLSTINFHIKGSFPNCKVPHHCPRVNVFVRGLGYVYFRHFSMLLPQIIHCDDKIRITFKLQVLDKTLSVLQECCRTHTWKLLPRWTPEWEDGMW